MERSHHHGQQTVVAEQADQIDELRLAQAAEDGVVDFIGRFVIGQRRGAEVEHGLNYKTSQALPERLQRKLYRISAILESVDDELTQLSSQIPLYLSYYLFYRYSF